MRKLAFVCVLLGVSCASAIATNAYAWGDEGDQIVCEIAFKKVQPSTQAAIIDLIKVKSEADSMPAFSTFSEACTWADHLRKHAPRHFVNLPRNATSLTNTCGVGDDCVVSAIALDLGTLSSKTATKVQRSASLKFLGHWVGDVHQPLHVSFEDDRGGNEVKVSGKCSNNMHSTWDTCLVEAAVGKDSDTAASKLMSSITNSQIQEWTKSDPKHWANESFKITESLKTKYCTMHGGSCERPSGTVQINQAYVDGNVPIVSVQLQKAGIRLAHLLDQALGE